MNTWGVTFKASGVSLTAGFYLICESPPALPAETSTDHSSTDNKWSSQQDNDETRAPAEQSSSSEDTMRQGRKIMSETSDQTKIKRDQTTTLSQILIELIFC